MKKDLELSAQNMQKYIGGPVMVKNMVHMIKNELDTGSKTIYPYAIEERVCYQKDNIKQFGGIIM